MSASNHPLPILQRETCVFSRSMEFFTEKELTPQIGFKKSAWPVALPKELLDNSLDAWECAGIPPYLTVALQDDKLIVTDNGPGLPLAVLEQSLNYSIRVSDKTGYIRPSRGQQDNALKTLWTAPFVATGEGRMAAFKAIPTYRREKLRTDLDAVASREIESPTDLYDVIVPDPPWPMQKIERDARENQVALDYPVMQEGEMSALSIPADDNCHVWLWTTHKFLPMAFRLLAAWEIKYVCTFVWNKSGGFQPFGLPQYNDEFYLYARKGTPQFVDTKEFNTNFVAARGKHRERPEAFYDTVRRVTAGRRLDMFSRRISKASPDGGKKRHERLLGVTQ